MQQSNKTQYVGFFRRGLAGLVDIILILTVCIFLNLPFSASIQWLYSSGKLISTVSYQNPVNLLLFLIILFLYLCTTESIWGKSLGKLIFRQKVVGLQKEKVSFGRIFVRNIVLPIDLIFGSIFFLFSKKSQILGDQLAHTIVIDTKNADIPIIDSDPKPRKTAGSILLALIVIFVGLMIYSMYQISTLNTAARTIIKNTQEPLDTPELVYNMFDIEAKKSITLDDIKKQIHEPVFSNILKKIEVDKIKFSYWRFHSTDAVVIGSQNNTGIRLYLKRDKDRSWKILDFRVN